MQHPDFCKPSDQRKRPSSGLSPAVDIAEGAAILNHYCTDLANQYALVNGFRVARWMPAIVVAAGSIASLSLMYVELAWFFFGVGFAIAGLAMTLLTGGYVGLGPIQRSTSRWFRVWPIWEYAVAGVLVIAVLGFAVWSGVWGPLLFGSVVGAVVPAIFYLTFVLSLVDQQEKIAASFNKLVNDLSEYGIEPRLIEHGLPKLMGANWIPLFEQQFGYSAYRSVAQHFRQADRNLLDRRPTIRDFVSDVIAQGVRSKRGPIVTAWKARQDHAKNIQQNAISEIPHAYWESDDVAEDDLFAADAFGIPLVDSDETQSDAQMRSDSRLTDSLTKNTGYGDDSLGAESWSLYLSTGDWEKIVDTDAASSSCSQPNRRKREHDEMMNRARGASELSPDVLQFERKMYHYLGDEKRLATAILLLVAFLAWVYQTNMVTGDFFSALWSAVKSFDPQSISASIARVTAALTQTEPSIVPIRVSGWSALIAAIVMGISSEQAGWRHSLFAIPACLIVLIGITATLVAGEPVIIAWMSVGISFALLLTSSIWVRHRHRQLFQSR